MDWCYLSLKSFGISSEVELSVLADGWDAWGRGEVKGDPKVWNLGKRGGLVGMDPGMRKAGEVAGGRGSISLGHINLGFL